MDKQSKRSLLTQKILKLSTAIVAFASVNGNSILAEKCDESLRDMGVMRDNDFYTFSQLIIREATPIMTDLAPFGVLPADLTAATAASEVYLANIQSPVSYTHLDVYKRQLLCTSSANIFSGCSKTGNIKASGSMVFGLYLLRMTIDFAPNLKLCCFCVF